VLLEVRVAVPQRLICVLAILVVASGTSPVRTQTKPSADAAKGTFVYNVLNFVEWPPSSLKANGGIHVAVISADPLPDFAAALNGRSVRGRSIVVKAYRTAGQLEPSEVVYIAADAISEVRAVLRAVNQQAVLTIAEQSLDTQGLTVLSLGVVDARLGFNANLEAADAAGLRIPTNLLKLAKTVRGRRARDGTP